jgi:purine-binding chemotaxis protein CheW
MSFTRYIFVTVGDLKLGLALEDVTEAIALPEISPIPFSKPYVSGIINLRGNILPIINMKKRLHVESNYNGDPYDAGIVICQSNGKPFGVLVDSIENVVSIADADIGGPPGIENNESPMYMKGIYKSPDGLIVLLSPQEIVKDHDFSEFTETLNKV